MITLSDKLQMGFYSSFSEIGVSHGEGVCFYDGNQRKSGGTGSARNKKPFLRYTPLLLHPGDIKNKKDAVKFFRGIAKHMEYLKRIRSNSPYLKRTNKEPY